MRRAVLVMLGLVVAFGAGAGFVARQQRGAGVEVVRPSADAGQRVRHQRSVVPGRGEPAPMQRADRREGRQPGSWRALQIGLDAINALVGLVGTGMAWRGMRRDKPASSHLAASQTPARMSASPNA
jgi:hypothetical protein